MMDGETLRDLLDKLPGFKVSGDKITVDGKEVKRTYVNGVLLFGDNTLTAPNALYASEVAQVKVYDEQTPDDKLRGLDNSEKQRVLDIKTQESLISFSDAVISVSGGADDTGQARYTGIGAAAFYSELLSFNAMGILDNTSQGLGQSLDFSPSSTLLNINSQSGQLSSYTEDTIAGASFEKYWDSRDFGNSIKASYKYSHAYNRNNAISRIEHYLEDGSQGRSSCDTTISGNHSGTHEVNMVLKLSKNPHRNIYGHFSGKFTEIGSHSRDAENVKSDGDELIRNEYETSNQNEYDLFGRLNYQDYTLPKFNFSSELSLHNNKTTTPSTRIDTLSKSTVRMNLFSDGIGKSTDAELSASAEWLPINESARTLSID